MKNINKTMKNKMQFIAVTVLGLASLGLTGCSSSSSENGPVVSLLADMSGVYRTAGDLTEDRNSVTSLEITNGQSEVDLEVMVLRNGLSFEERVYLNILGEVQWADSKFGRTLNLKNLKEGLKAKNRIDGDVTFVDVCGDKVSLDSRTMDFRYCLELKRNKGSLIAKGKLILEIFEFGALVHTIKTPFEVFTKDRWFVDYFGEWTGELTYKNGNALGLSLESGNRLDVTFQPVTETEFILRPLDNNQTISLYGEIFALYPDTRDMSDLEESANPYINFIYVSEDDGARRIYFNSFVHSEGYIEGSIQLKFNGVNEAILGTYILEQIK